MHGIDQLKIIVEALAEMINVTYKIVKGGGILAALALIDEISALKTIVKDELVAQVKELSPAERAELLAVFKAKLVLADTGLEAKIEAGGAVLDELVELGMHGYGLFLEAKALAEKVKGLFE